MVGDVDDAGVRYMQCAAEANSNGCGHYTQVVWAESSNLGCGYAQCTVNSPFDGFDTWDNWVCNYDPPGNVEGEFDANVRSNGCKK